MVLPEPRALSKVPMAGLQPVTALSELPAQRVLRQLLEALMFEGVIAYHPGDCNRTGWQWLSFQAGNLHGRCRARIRGFGRLRLDTSSLTLERNQKPVSLSVTTLVAQLPAANSHQQSLLTELLATISNSERLDALRKARHSGDRRNLHGEALDSALHEGHPYHPCFKSRLGFQGDDLVQYSPETSTGFRLHWVAIPRHNLDSQLPSSDMAFWQSELGQEQAYLLRAAFHRAGVDWQQYGALPTHPWHWQKLSQGSESARLEALGIKCLGPLGDRYLPGQSLRSLFNASRPAKACVKLPLGIHNTSSRRHLEPHSVPSAPVISRWLESIVAGDPLFDTTYPLRLMPEYASLGVAAGDEQGADNSGLAGELAAIWRASIGSRLHEGEQAIPLNALFQWQPDGMPFIHPWVEHYGLVPWLEATLKAVILPVWHMLAAHGVGLEAHAQNSLLVARSGWPRALMLRDFHDSVEYARDYLPQTTPEPDFGPRQAFYDQAPDNQYYRMSNPEALRELVMDTLFIFNLSELALVLEEAYGFNEARFWDRVRTILTNYARQHPEQRSRLDRLGWDQPNPLTESLLRSKLQPDIEQPRHRVPNPLAPGPNDTLMPFIDHHHKRLP
ncbi:IucA/IucC family protein [Marinobacter nauticus]|uniref:IucA/IucC family protein n=1 Tax=Marinobacter nauticus TaxID=2743 RepID=UPI001C97DA7A|nr:IucA/IucC family protein [Marinobacter nauticus]MBY6103880.1 IucA/IucC family protein [Marinobacter nauticus]